MTLDTNNTSSEKLLTTIQQEYKILAEYKMIQSEDVAGVYVIPSHDNSFLWFGVVFIREGYYKDGIFRFNISLPDNFPKDKNPPTVIFQNEIFHPLICPYTGTLNVSEAFPNWIEGTNHLWQLLKFIRYIFIHPQDCLLSLQQYQQQQQQDQQISKYSNQIAAELLSQNKAEFIGKAKDSVSLSLQHVLDPPPTEDCHYITFEEFDAEIHGPVLENLKKNADYVISSSSPPQSTGLSWVKEEEFKPLSRD